MKKFSIILAILLLFSAFIPASVLAAENDLAPDNYLSILSVDSSPELSSISVGGVPLDGFNPQKYSYSHSVAANIARISVSATADSTNLITIKGTGTKRLKYGKNVFKIYAYSQNKKIRRTYTLTVYRAYYDVAELSSLHLSTGRLEFGFDKSAPENYIIVPGAKSVRITPKKQSSLSKMKINNKSVSSVSVSVPSTGYAAVAVDITAHDKVTKRRYTFYIGRSAPDEILPVVFPIPKNNDLDGKIIMIDPGHGAGNRSSVGGGSVGYVERDWTLKYGLMLRQNLENSGATVYMTRDTATGLSNIRRINKLNLLGLTTLRDYFISQLPEGTVFSQATESIIAPELSEKPDMTVEPETPEISPNGEEPEEIDAAGAESEHATADFVVTEQDTTPDDSENLEQPGESVSPGGIIVQTTPALSETEKLISDIAELDRLIEILERVDTTKSLEGVYYNSPYDRSKRTKIHPELAKVFEFLKNQYLQERLIFVSLHTNGLNGKSQGSSSYYMNNTCNKAYYTGYLTENNKRLASTFVNHVADSGFFVNKKAHANDFFHTRETTLPSTIIEIGYHDFASDRAKITAPVNMQRIVGGLSAAAVEFFG